MAREQQHKDSVVLIMGATGTGKSTFINLLTGDDKIRIGHSQQSETLGVHMAHYVDQATGCPIKLIDTPGFDDSREDVTDTDVLEKIVRFLEPGGGQNISVNGIIYMHRISDPRVGGTSRKNLKMFYSLCGEKNLAHVRIVTTNWSRVTEHEGNYREADLMNGAFKPFLDPGARMSRHAGTFESAQQIMSELISLPSVTMNIQEELRAGKKLADTSAGQVLMELAQEMKRKHERASADLEKEVDEAEEERNRALLAELELERKHLAEKMERADADRKKLQVTLAMMHVGSGHVQGGSKTPGNLCEGSKDTLEIPRTDALGRDTTERDGTVQYSCGVSSGAPTEPQSNYEKVQASILDIDRDYERMETEIAVLKAKIRHREKGYWWWGFGGFPFWKR